MFDMLTPVMTENFNGYYGEWSLCYKPFQHALSGAMPIGAA